MENEEPTQNVTTSINVVDSLMAETTVTTHSLTDLSIQYIQSAALYTRLCYEVENRHKPYIPNSLSPEEFDLLLTEHKAHAISAIFASVSFLESTINKFFLVDVAEQLEKVINKFFANTTSSEDIDMYKPLDRHASQLLLIDMPKSGLAGKDYGPVHEKFDGALASCGKDKFDRSKFPYQDVTLLVNLRNALVHYKPEWITVFTTGMDLPEKVDDKKLEQLRKKYIPRSPFIPGPERLFFPQQCLSHGHAKWAVNTSLQFADEFFKKMSMSYPYDPIRVRLKTEP